MKIFNLFFVVAILALCLSGCGKDEVTDPADTTYQLFPNGYFSKGFREEYSISGTSPSGLVLKGTHLELTEDAQTFEGQEVNPVRTQSEWKDTKTNAEFSIGALSFYSTNADDRKLIGSEDLFTKATVTYSGQQSLPISAKIGDSGTTGSFVDSHGTKTTQTWRLEDAGEGRAKIVWVTEVRTALGGLFSEGYLAYEIDTHGNRKSLTILFDVKSFNDPVSWVGEKI